MCLAIPGRVIKVMDKKAVVDFLGEKKEVKISIVRPKVNDYVLVQFGTVVEILDKKTAEESLNAWKLLKHNRLFDSSPKIL